MDVQERLVCVREFWNEGAAASASALLEENGITCTIQGGMLRTNLNYLGSIISGVKLLVAQEDAETARTLLDTEEAETTPEQTPPWTCPGCRSEVDVGFDVCWSCGGPRPTAPVGTPETLRTGDDVQSVGAGTTSEASPTAPESEDDRARRLLRGAVFTLIMVPLFVLMLPLAFSIDRRQLSSRGTRNYWVAVLLLLCAFLMWSMILTM